MSNLEAMSEIKTRLRGEREAWKELSGLLGEDRIEDAFRYAQQSISHITDDLSYIEYQESEILEDVLARA